MREVAVLGAGMTCFGKFPHETLKSLGRAAVQSALRDARVETDRLEAAFVGNAIAGLMTGQG